jgi:hypothetical protein
MTTTTTTTVTFKNKIISWDRDFHVQRTDAQAADLKKARWMEHVPVADIVKVSRVKVWATDPKFPASAGFEPPYDCGWEVSFRSGALAYITDYGDGHSEINAIVINGKGYLHGLAVWRKRGHIVGSPCAWFRTQAGSRGKLLNPNKAPRCCALELYKRTAGLGWPTDVAA